MKDGLKYLVGKRIAGVVFAKSNRSPQCQVFLVFPDGTRFEFYGDNFSCCSGLDDGKTIQRYVESNQGEIRLVYYEGRTTEREPDAPMSTGGERADYRIAPPETLMGRMKRDLEAWELAKLAIAKAQM